MRSAAGSGFYLTGSSCGRGLHSISLQIPNPEAAIVTGQDGSSEECCFLIMGIVEHEAGTWSDGRRVWLYGRQG